MKRFWGWAAMTVSLAAAGAVATQAFAIPEPDLVFRATPVVDPATREIDAIDIDMVFRGAADGTTRVEFPDEWGGFSGLYRYANHIRADGATMAAGTKPGERLLTHEPGATVRLSYRIARRIIADPLDGNERVNNYKPIVTADYFHLLGPTYIARPSHLDDSRAVRVELGAMPAGMSLASDLQHVAAGANTDFATLVDSVIVGGDFRLLDTGDGARIAIRGTFKSRTDAEWLSSLRRVAVTARDYWGDGDFPYLVTIMASPRQPHGRQNGGTGLGDAFAFFATEDSDPLVIDDTMMHEMTHTWITNRVGQLALTGGREAEQYWLSEGFTDFVKMRLMVRAGLWDAAAFAGAFNALQSELAASPFVAAPNLEVAPKFWTDHSGQRLPYLRGALFAMLADQLLRRKSGGRATMDDVLRGMKARAAAGDPGDAIALFRAGLTAKGVGAGPLIARHIDQGVPIVLAPDSFAPCGTLEARSTPAWTPGFAVSALRGDMRVIGGVEEGGPAWKAGLRDGMKALGWSIYANDMTKEIEITIDDGGKPREVKYLPVGDRQVHYQELVLRPLSSDAERALCLKRLGGV
ncbi:hypothetical protein [Sphingopyxis sp. PET50]|uniref:M61 family metallopeptidase n=1 Tax=Sphingopyxis sp. PET50 TaxID=2976533 RepID=UPI0021AFDE18|nr:hypothetical protein [Sphingopyxis sp. PET50]